MTGPAMLASAGFGRLTPLLSPRSVAILGASDRDGNLGGVGLRFLKQFGFAGALYPVNPSQSEVSGLVCYPDLNALPEVPDLAILAVPAAAVADAVRACGHRGIPAAIVWAGGFAEAGPEGQDRQRALAQACSEAGVMLCGPNSVGVVNTSIGLTATFSNLFHGQTRLMQGCVSMVSQSGGVSVNVLNRARAAGYGVRVTVSVGNECNLTLADFLHAVALDEGTRVIAVYAEGLADPEGFVAGLRLARERGKPVVILKGGASEASGRAALAHTGRLAGADRTFDAVLQEFAVIRVRSTEEMIDVCGQLASMRPGLGPRNDSVLISTFGGGVGVISTDQCVRAGMQVPVMPPDESASLGRNLSPLSSAANPVDMTPGVMTDPKLRARLPAAIDQMALETRYGAWLFMSSGFGNLAPQLIDMLTRARELADKPILVTWQSMPEGVAELLAERGFYVFHDSARAVRVLELLVRHQQALAQPPRWSGAAPEPGEGAQAWPSASRRETRVLSEPEVAGLLSHAGLPVAPGRFVPAGSDPVACARELGFPVVLKGISPRVTHRAAVGLVALYLDSEAAVGAAVERFKDIERSIGVNLDGFWVQTMMGGQRELLVTALRDPQFGVFVGCGVGGVQTELIDDVVLARAPVDRVHAAAMVRRMRSLKRFPDWLDATQIEAVAGFVSRFSEWAATAPWASFTIEVNPIKVQADRVVAVDGLVVIDQDP